MNINITVHPEKKKIMPFRFSNIQNRYGANSLHFTKDEKPFLPLSGEFHFSRYPRNEWKQELLKMRALGLNIVATYVFWNHHEVKKGKFNFEGDRDIYAFLSVCREIGMPCLLRIGPWCHGEVIYGGFPQYVARMPLTRRNSSAYLKAVRRYFMRLYGEIRDFMDGDTIIGIQLENEYGGSISHIHTLRKMVEEIGYKTAFFTMTAWPTNTPDLGFLPMMGGYPEAPWTQHKKPLSPNNRFAITPHKTEAEIGGDLVKSNEAQKGIFDDFPYAGCEVGPGNQVTQHRRPVLSDKDGYGVAFAKFACGMNWLGYYMFHGGRNPNDGLYQENRRTFYPNNYPIIDYDFQAPISRYGYFRKSAHRLRLLHTFINSFDSEIAAKPAYFPDFQPKSPFDVKTPKCSVRMDENLSGYCFITSYERMLEFPDFSNVCISVSTKSGISKLPSLSVPAGSMFFYPFNFTLEGRHFEYITTQPIAKVNSAEQTDIYFMIPEGITPLICTQGEVISGILPDSVGYSYKNGDKTVCLHFLSERRALDFYLIENRVVFSSAALYSEDNKIVTQARPDSYLQTGGSTLSIGSNEDLSNAVLLEQITKRRLPYNTYLYSHSKRRYYRLKIDPQLLLKNYDIELIFSFSGLNLQVFSSSTLVDDCFNTDGYYRICLRQYLKYLEKCPELIIRTVAQTRFGVGNVYNEIQLGYNNELQLVKAIPVSMAESTLT